MRTEYRRNLNKSYLILTDRETEECFEWKMLENNRIRGLLPVHCRHNAGESAAWYDISGTQSLDRYLETAPVDGRFFRMLLSELKRMGELLPSYLLLQQDLLLDPELIFIRHDGTQVYFCYHPETTKDLFLALRELMEMLLQRVDHRDEEAVRTAYAIYQITTEGEFDLDMLLKETENKTPEHRIRYEEPEPEPEKPGGRVFFPMEEPKEKPRRKGFHFLKRKKEEPSEESLFDELVRMRRGQEEYRNPGGSRDAELYRDPEEYHDPEEYQEPDRSRRSKERRASEKRRVSSDREFSKREPETVTGSRLYPEENTTYLNPAEDRARGVLRYLGHGTESDLTIETVPFLIGTREGLPGQMDSQAVSRQHARITKEGEDYYLEDLNSTNGTFHNGEELSYRLKVRLFPNDHIRFADEEFLFL